MITRSRRRRRRSAKRRRHRQLRRACTEVIRRSSRRRARSRMRRGLRSVVLTFDPHPAAVLGRTFSAAARDARTTHRAAPGARRRRGRSSNLSPSSSPRTVPNASRRSYLEVRLDARAIVVGENFRFGKATSRRSEDARHDRRCARIRGGRRRVRRRRDGAFLEHARPRR